MIVQVCEENLRVLLFFWFGKPLDKLSATGREPSRGQELGVNDVRALTTYNRSHLR